MEKKVSILLFLIKIILGLKNKKISDLYHWLGSKRSESNFLPKTQNESVKKLKKLNKIMEIHDEICFSNDE